MKNIVDIGILKAPEPLTGNYTIVGTTILKDRSIQPKALAVYMLFLYYCGIPGFQIQLTMFKNTYNVKPREIKALKKAGYLKQYRIRTKEGWTYQYEVLDEPDLTRPAFVNVKAPGASTGEAGEVTFQQNRERKPAHFVKIPNDLILDTSLPLETRGLYARVKNYVNLKEKSLRVEQVRYVCNVGLFTFRRIWKQLKDSGYLKQYRLPHGNSGGWDYEYVLLNKADTTTPSLVNLKGEKNSRKEKKEATYPQNKQEIRDQQIKEQIDFQDLCNAFSNKPWLYQILEEIKELDKQGNKYIPMINVFTILDFHDHVNKKRPDIKRIKNIPAYLKAMFRNFLEEWVSISILS